MSDITQGVLFPADAPTIPDGWRVKWMPRDGRPDRGRITCGVGSWATFESADDARLYLDHPSDTAPAARLYLALLDGPR